MFVILTQVHTHKMQKQSVNFSTLKNILKKSHSTKSL